MIERLGASLTEAVSACGRMVLLGAEGFRHIFSRPVRVHLIFKQMQFIGLKSIPVVALTGTFSGMVLALQSYNAVARFQAESLVGATVALAMAREMGPVMTALMVTGRAGSAMAAEIGTMRVTEQIDALSAMAVNPIHYLVTPRILAAIVMVPALTVLFVFVGILGGYLVGVVYLGIHGGSYINSSIEFTDAADLTHGLWKALFFAVVLTVVGCYKGFYTSGGAEGVGRRTTESVVMSSVLILVSDYFLTAVLY
ncbi:MAG: ABC transporter permease [Myxococcales bacterium]|nr:ABC transporter permease [Myxococcales bacterium]